MSYSSMADTMNVFKMIFIILCIHWSGKPFNENFEHTYRDLKCKDKDRNCYKQREII